MGESAEANRRSMPRRLAVALFWGLVLSPVAMIIGLALSPVGTILPEVARQPEKILEILKNFAPLVLPGTLIVLPCADYWIRGKDADTRHRFIMAGAVSGFLLPALMSFVLSLGAPTPTSQKDSLADMLKAVAFIASMTGLPGAISGGLTAALFFRITRGRVVQDPTA